MRGMVTNMCLSVFDVARKSIAWFSSLKKSIDWTERNRTRNSKAQAIFVKEQSSFKANRKNFYREKWR